MTFFFGQYGDAYTKVFDQYPEALKVWNDELSVFGKKCPELKDENFRINFFKEKISSTLRMQNIPGVIPCVVRDVIQNQLVSLPKIKEILYEKLTDGSVCPKSAVYKDLLIGLAVATNWFKTDVGDFHPDLKREYDSFLLNSFDVIEAEGENGKSSMLCLSRMPYESDIKSIVSEFWGRFGHENQLRVVVICCQEPGEHVYPKTGEFVSSWWGSSVFTDTNPQFEWQKRAIREKFPNVNIEYRWLVPGGIKDSSMTKAFTEKPLTPDELIKFFDDLHKPSADPINNGLTIVHCASGKSRSATVVICKLMYDGEYNLTDAIDRVKIKRNKKNFESYNQEQRIFMADFFAKVLFGLAKDTKRSESSILNMRDIEIMFRYCTKTSPYFRQVADLYAGFIIQQENFEKISSEKSWEGDMQTMHEYCSANIYIQLLAKHQERNKPAPTELAPSAGSVEMTPYKKPC